MAHRIATDPAWRPLRAAARVIADAATVRRPRARYTVGRDAAILTRLSRVLSDRVLDRVLAANLRPHFPKAGQQRHGSGRSNVPKEP